MFQQDGYGSIVFNFGVYPLSVQDASKENKALLITKQKITPFNSLGIKTSHKKLK